MKLNIEIIRKKNITNRDFTFCKAFEHVGEPQLDDGGAVPEQRIIAGDVALKI